MRNQSEMEGRSRWRPVVVALLLVMLLQLAPDLVRRAVPRLAHPYAVTLPARSRAD